MRTTQSVRSTGKNTMFFSFLSHFEPKRHRECRSSNAGTGGLLPFTHKLNYDNSPFIFLSISFRGEQFIRSTYGRRRVGTGTGIFRFVHVREWCCLAVLREQCSCGRHSHSFRNNVAASKRRVKFVTSNEIVIKIGSV